MNESQQPKSSRGYLSSVPVRLLRLSEKAKQFEKFILSQYDGQSID